MLELFNQASLRDSTATPLPSVTPSLSAYKQPDFEWMRGSAGEELGLRVWRGEERKASLIYLHGIEGHGEWFAHTAAALNQAGLSVYVPDRRGAGMNEGERGHMQSYKQVLRDTELLVERIGKERPGAQLIFLGNCWGAKAAAVMAASHYQTTQGQPLALKPSGLILTCPALFTLVDFDVATKIRIALDILPGSTSQLRSIDIPIEPSMFTSNPEFLAYIEKDPLRLKSATSRFYFENFLLSCKAASAARRIDLPLLILQSQNDRIVNVAKVKHWFDQVASARKEWRLFPDAFHSIDFETDLFQEYVSLLVDWVAKLAVQP